MKQSRKIKEKKKKQRSGLLRTIAWCGIFLMVGSSIYSQMSMNIAPLARNFAQIVNLNGMPNDVRYAECHPDLFHVVSAIRKLPGDGAVFMAPVFSDDSGAEYGTFFWWHLGVTLRHFCFPRKVFTLHETLYSGDKTLYLQKYQRDAECYEDLYFLEGRNVAWVLSFVNGSLQLAPVSSKIIQ